MVEWVSADKNRYASQKKFMRFINLARILQAFHCKETYYEIRETHNFIQKINK